MLPFFLFCSWILIATGCDKTDDDTFRPGTYVYSGYDLDGQKVTEGQIEIHVEDSLITGFKNIKEAIIGDDFVSVLDTGEGIIVGQIDENGLINITLTETDGPYMIIRGIYKDGVFKGQRYWGVSGGAPETVIGTFKSYRTK